MLTACAARRDVRSAQSIAECAGNRALDGLGLGSSSSEWRSSIATLRIVPMGLAMPLPAMSGAEPWIGS